VKSEWLARRLLVNIDVFRSNYRELQSPVTLLSPSGVLESVVRNAASARTQGVELEAQGLPSDRLRRSALRLSESDLETSFTIRQSPGCS
jgi:iron complex outermembrane recepter protein